VQENEKKAAGGEGSSAVQASRPKTAAIPRAAIAFFFLEPVLPVVRRT